MHEFDRAIRRNEIFVPRLHHGLGVARWDSYGLSACGAVHIVQTRRLWTSDGRPPLGQRQIAVLALSGLGNGPGLAASDVAKALGHTPSNATNTLTRLEELHYVVRVPRERTVLW